MKATTSIAGIILHCRNYADHDVIVTIYTPEHGKLSCFARSAKRSKKRFLGGLLPGANIQGIINPPQGNQNLWKLDSLHHVSLYDCFMPHSKDLMPRMMGSYILDLWYSMPQYPDHELFHLLDDLLMKATTKQVHLFMVHAHMQILLYSGLLPDFMHCNLCSKPFRDDEPCYIPNKQTTIHCTTCHTAWKHQGLDIALSAKQRQALIAIGNRKRPADIVDKQLVTSSRALIEWTFGRKLQSTSIIDSLLPAYTIENQTTKFVQVLPE